jgi:hypothetical protein
VATLDEITGDEGILLVDARTIVVGGVEGEEELRNTTTVWFKTTAAGVLSFPIPRDLWLVYVNANNAGLVSRLSDTYVNQTTAAGASEKGIVAYFTASINSFTNAPFLNGEICYFVASTGLQGTAVFAEKPL